MTQFVLEKVRQYLTDNEIPFRGVSHEPTYTSEESAAARGEDVRIGGKAIVLKVDDIFRLFVLSAALRIDSGAIKRYLKARRIRFASEQELLDFTGLSPGSIPPFGDPVLPFMLYVDESILLNQKIAFNAGSLTESIVMSVQDYIRLTKPEIFRFSKGELPISHSE